MMFRWVAVLFYTTIIPFSAWLGAEGKGEGQSDGVAHPELCKKYEGHYVAYYSEVFHVQDCARVLLTQVQLENVLRDKQKVEDVSGEVIRALPLRDVVVQAAGPVRECKVFEKRFVTGHFVHVYYVEKCQKRVFPDWDSWAEYQKHHPELSSVILQLSDAELDQIPNGAQFPSVFDSIQMVGEEEVPDLLPLDEACQGLDGAVVSYYQHVYRIENCRKRQISADSLLASQLKKPYELSAQQWMSLPNGKDILSSKESLELDGP
ncbi:MAG: hypothetical protein AB8C84_00850 [Oligoflexales bacterium]